ncbi:MAG: protease complex subunit PrcB family protein [Eubacteriales bacterium]|nr:protease complex subunit PrcB family protein [Eubacteriales bacterium]
MKRAYIGRIAMVLLSVIIAGATTGCKDSDGQETTGNEGIAHNDIEFDIIEDETALPENIRNDIEALKSGRGYVWYKDGAGYYVVVFSGEKTTGGYGIKVTEVEDIEGITKITVEEWSPGKDEYVTQVLTYPRTVIRIEKVTDNFEVVGTDKAVFAEIAK